MKAHVIDQSLNKSIVMSYYLIPSINQHQLTGLISFQNHNDRLRLANKKPNTNYIISTQNVCNLEIANLSQQRLHFFYMYLSFYTIYELETLRVYCYSPSIHTGQILSKFEIWLKIWLEGL